MQNKKFTKPFVIYKVENNKALDAAKKVIEFLLTECKCEKIYIEDINILNANSVFEKEEDQKKYDSKFEQFELNTQKSDLCIILGGDGTVLWAKNKYKDKIIPPFLTFNLGNLGFLAFYSADEYKIALTELFFTQQFSFEKRSLIKCSIYSEKDENNENGSKIPKYSYYCLNDVVFDKGAEHKMLNFELKVNGENFTTILGDGILFSTPSGSSGYNLSANGPLINYKVKCFIMNALCPFTLSWRPIVFPPEFIIRLRNTTNELMGCIVDGAPRVNMTKEDYAEITMNDEKIISLIHIKKIVESGYIIWKKKLTSSLGWNVLPGQK